MSSLPHLEATETPAPEKLGRYEILAPLGTGGMAVVYRARDTATGVERAVKLLHSEAASHKGLRQRFLGEARTMAQFVHPNILRIFEVGVDHDGGADRCWYAMELIESGTVQKHLDTEGPFEPLRALKIVFDVLQALGAAHAAGVVHRDVKPQNMLMREDGTTMLGDFGSARQAVASELTRTGDMLGTIGYMAPEQRNDARGASQATDIYAVGASLFGLITGRPPLGLFEGELDKLFLARLPAEVRQILRNATRYSPENRYASAREMAIDVARTHDRLTAVAVGADAPEGAAAEIVWMARFDDLLSSCVPDLETEESPTRAEYVPPRPPRPPQPVKVRRTSTSAPSAVRPPEGKVMVKRARTTPSLPPVAPKPPAKPLAALWANVVAAGSALFGLGTPPANQPLAAVNADLKGTWEGRVADVLPLRIELEEVSATRIAGWGVTTGLRGEVVTRIVGQFEGDALVLHEMSERADRGIYTGRVDGDAIVGEFRAIVDGAPPMGFRLERSAKPRTDG
jgi:serine/threonine protein kinase